MRKSALMLLAMAILVLLLAPTLLSYAQSNAGFLRLNNNTFDEESLRVFTLAARYLPDNAASHRGLGYANQARHRLDISHVELNNGGFTPKDFILFAEKANKSNALSTARDWLLIAEMEEPSNPDLWHVAGKLCQKDPQIDVLCERFLDNNQRNWLVNSDLTFAKDGWHTRNMAGYNLEYNIEPCPSEQGGLCATMSTGATAPEHGISWSQCVDLEPGKKYSFSAWIKADVDPDTEWRPVYIQGSVDGNPKGMWPETQEGPSIWTFWEQEFSMPAFDHNQACFYPVRLMGNGEITFNRSSLTRLK